MGIDVYYGNRHYMMGIDITLFIGCYESQLAGSLLSANEVSKGGLGAEADERARNLAITWGEGCVF